MVNVQNIEMTITDTLFTEISSAGMGGVIKANSLSKLSIDTVSVSKISISGSYNAAYEGVFLYMSNSDVLPFTLNLQDSAFTCKTLVLGVLGFSLLPTVIDYYSVFYITKSNQNIIYASSNNQFSNCYTASNGGIYNLNPGSAVTTFTDTLSSYQYISAYNSGGVSYILNAQTLDIPNTYYNMVSSFSNGGAIYSSVYDILIDFTDVRASNIAAGGKGGFSYLYDLNSGFTYKVQCIGTTSTSSYYNSINSDSDGGVFYFYMSVLEFTFNQVKSNLVASVNGNGGFLSQYNLSPISSQLITISNSIISSVTAALEGGLIYTQVKNVDILIDSASSLSSIVA